MIDGLSIPCNQSAGIAEDAARESAQDARQAAINERADALMLPGAKCYPWEPENFQEAISQFHDHKVNLFAACIEQAVKFDLKNDTTNHLTLVSLRMAVESYWRSVALHVAEKDY